MPIIQRPYVPPEDQVPQEDEYVNPGDTQESGSTGEPITFYAFFNYVSFFIFKNPIIL